VIFAEKPVAAQAWSCDFRHSGLPSAITCDRH